MNEFYRKCSTCKQEIGWGGDYYSCSVSTCNQKRTALFFCSLACWDAHVPTARHRDAWAERQKAPERPAEGSAELLAAESKRRVVAARPSSPQRVSIHPALTGRPETEDTLVVVSKLKAYVKERSGMNTSAGVVQILSDRLRELCDLAIIEAAANERRTVLDRDLEAVVQRLQIPNA